MRSTRAPTKRSTKANDLQTSGGLIQDNTWYHIACRYDLVAQTKKVYVNGVEVATGTSTPYQGTSGNVVVGSLNGGSQWFTGMVDDVQVYQKALSVAEIQSIMQGLADKSLAQNLSPANGATDMPRDVTLIWTAGQYPSTHDVYFGTTWADVDNATQADKTGVLASKGQEATTFDLPAALAYGQTYYWRVDEVNQSPDQTVHKGSVWSFTVEPVTYAMKNITVSASGSALGQRPEKTTDGSGLDASDLHGTTDTTMWLSDGSTPAWIQYAFDDVYKLQEMWVWNSNQSIETTAGMGVKDVVVQYSVDGATWTTLAGVPPLAKAPGTAGYAHNTTVAFNGAAAKYVKLTINSNWGGIMPQIGLSEVRFYYKPVQARLPQPATAATGVAPSLTLTWRTGHEAASHQVYLGTDPNALTLAGTTTQSSFTPAAINLGTTYYWRVDEVNTAETPGLWTGKVWSFATQVYQAIDDFESYNDTNNIIYDTWPDNYDLKATVQYGAQVGNDKSANGTFGETTTVHPPGKQSMPLHYNNGGPKYLVSETTRTWTSPQDWTRNGATTLSLYFQGNPAGFLQLAPDHILMNGIGTDIYGTADQGRFVYKQLSGDGTIIARVEGLTNTNPWAKAGVMIRQTLDAGSSNAYVLASPGHGVHFQARLLTNGSAATDTTADQAGVTVPVWLKLERKGSQFNGYYATGVTVTTWTPMPWNPQTITMSGPTYIGLAVTSHSASAVTQAEFSAISSTGTVTGDWQSVDLGIAQPAGNTPDTFYVTVKDSAGNSVTLKNTDPRAVLAGSWQQWPIPLTDLAPVNPAKIKTLILGVGDQTAPQHGVGTLYIDDIAAGRPAPAAGPGTAK
ncbi:MAG: discoidin domain-containing protein [Planctomycetes bacterium]|nr:discoidin domain-containing protein [Planctomycetota bacterium]